MLSTCRLASLEFLGIRRKSNCLVAFQILTHIRLASFLWDIGKQCKTRRLTTVCLQKCLYKLNKNLLCFITLSNFLSHQLQNDLF